MSSSTGRPVGIARARKSPEERSKVLNTVRELQRRYNKTGFAAKLEAAKRADNAAFDYAKKKLRATNTWKNASPDEQTSMLAAKKEEVKAKR